MGQAAFKMASYQDVLDAPEHMIAEILDGELFTLPRPAPRHAYAACRIMVEFGGFSRGKNQGASGGGWRTLFAPELHLGQDILVPDVAGWKRSRLPRLPSEAYFTLPPDWVCEVVSPSTARLDRTLKKRIYASHGIEWLWLVDPIAQTLEVLQRSGELWQEVQRCGGTERVSPQPFEGLWVELSDWWGEDPEAPVGEG